MGQGEREGDGVSCWKTEWRHDDPEQSKTNVWKGKGETHLAVVLNFSVSRTLNPFFFSAAFLFRRDIWSSGQATRGTETGHKARVGPTSRETIFQQEAPVEIRTISHQAMASWFLKF